MTALNPKQKQFLRALAHELNPVVQVGKNGLSDSTFDQIREQLKAHELIKVKFLKEAPVDPAEAAPLVESATNSEVVQQLGRLLIVYRRHDNKPKIELPKR